MSIKSFFQQYGFTFIVCIMFFVILTPRQFGYLFILVVLGALLWIVSQIGLVFTGKNAGEVAIQIIMLLITFVAIGGVYQYRATTEQQELDVLVKSIETYKKQHGIYPAKLEDADKAYQQKRYIHYAVSELTTEPQLLYISSFQTIDGGYFYDFKKHAWLPQEN